MAKFDKLTPPQTGEKISINPDGSIKVSDQPIIPFIEGDGTGPDIWHAAVQVFDAAVHAIHAPAH